MLQGLSLWRNCRRTLRSHSRRYWRLRLISVVFMCPAGVLLACIDTSIHRDQVPLISRVATRASCRITRRSSSWHMACTLPVPRNRIACASSGAPSQYPARSLTTWDPSSPQVRSCAAQLPPARSRAARVVSRAGAPARTVSAFRRGFRPTRTRISRRTLVVARKLPCQRSVGIGPYRRSRAFAGRGHSFAEFVSSEKNTARLHHH